MRYLKPLCLGLLVMAASCVQILGDHPYTSQEEGAATPCNTQAECDDQNPCTDDTCGGNKLCAHVVVPDGVPGSQIAGDCKRIECASGEQLVVYDDADKPDDNEPCTTDLCAAGTPSHAPLVDGESCQRGPDTGTCLTGTCQIACTLQMPCDDMNPCTNEACDLSTSTCVFTSIDGLPTPGVAQTDKDCKIQLCVNGVDSVVYDDGDVPVDGNSCTQDLCAQGVPSNPGVAAGESCQVGQPEVCDGNGQCVACTEAQHCVGITETDCIQRSCVANTCQPMYLDQSVPAASQIKGDCQRNVCNGVDGGSISIADSTDTPNDNNPCTTDTCNAGIPKFTNAAAGTNCGGANVCNATGGCVGCNAPTDCAGTDDSCKQRTCTNNVCGVQYAPINTALPGANQTAMDCKVVVCDGNGNTKTNPDTTDVPPDDANQCTKNICSAQGTPTYPFEAIGTICNQNGGDVCNGAGACRKSPGKTCAVNAECVLGFCTDGFCCDSACIGTCKACNVIGKAGSCSNVVKGASDGSCTGTTTCDGAGSCKAVDGQSCAIGSQCVNANCVDSVCCESACSGTCKACNNPGSVGLCTNLPLGSTDSNPVNTCTGTNQCDGAGNCKKTNGQICASSAECLLGFCVDGVCCNTSCTGSCFTCSAPGMVGACYPTPAYSTDSPSCPGMALACDGAGSCKLVDGQPCTMNTECLSGACAGNPKTCLP